MTERVEPQDGATFATARTTSGHALPAGWCREAVERTVAAFGGLNVLVSNAAYLNSKTDLADLTDADWDRTFKTNAYAYFRLVMAAPAPGEGDAVIATTTEER